jgi:hypothetical protein
MARGHVEGGEGFMMAAATPGVPGRLNPHPRLTGMGAQKRLGLSYPELTAARAGSENLGRSGRRIARSEEP